MTTSVRKRFAFTVGANLLRSLISFATGMLVARWLEPQAYGRMAFLLGSFVAVRQLLDMGSSTAFFTFMSQRLRSRNFVRSFMLWLAVQFLLALLVIGLLFPDRWIDTIWHNESRGLVLLAFAAAFAQFSIWPVLLQSAESQRRTVFAQSVAVVIVAAHLLAVALLWLFDVLGLYAILAAVVFEYAIGVLVLRRVLIYDESPPEEGGVLGRFATYCLPLVPYAVCGFAYEFADRWLLQQYGGSVEQAYYAVSAQFASISLIATTSILNILWKEIAEAHHRGDVDRAAVLYQRVSRSLFLVGAAMAGFLLPWAETLLRLVLGDAYAGGAVTLGIMFLYPVHQSMGQIGNTMLYATERVATQVIVGIVFMILSIAVSYTVLAPSDAKVPGFGLASTGLAIKMVAMQFVQVNVIAYIIARIWKWRFDWLYQPVSLLGCLALGWLAHAAVASVATVSWPVTASIAAGGVLYLLLFVAFLYAMPWLAGFRRQELIMDTLNLLRKLPTPWLKHS